MKHVTRLYEIQWLNDGANAIGYVGWTPDGIGDANEFSSIKAAEKCMADLRRHYRQQDGKVSKMRVVELERA